MHKHPQGGFTLIELMVATAITGILAATAYPSFQGPICKARRVDGLTALLQLQMRQETWRSEHTQYANLDELKAQARSSMGYYRLSVPEATAAGFTAMAKGTGPQANDRACQVLSITVANGQTSYASGADEQASNDSATNKRCWNQ